MDGRRRADKDKEIDEIEARKMLRGVMPLLEQAFGIINQTMNDEFERIENEEITGKSSTPSATLVDNENVESQLQLLICLVWCGVLRRCREHLREYGGGVVLDFNLAKEDEDEDESEDEKENEDEDDIDDTEESRNSSIDADEIQEEQVTANEAEEDKLSPEERKFYTLFAKSEVFKLYLERKSGETRKVLQKEIMENATSDDAHKQKRHCYTNAFGEEREDGTSDSSDSGEEWIKGSVEWEKKCEKEWQRRTKRSETIKQSMSEMHKKSGAKYSSFLASTQTSLVDALCEAKADQLDLRDVNRILREYQQEKNATKTPVVIDIEPDEESAKTFPFFDQDKFLKYYAEFSRKKPVKSFYFEDSPYEGFLHYKMSYDGLAERLKHARKLHAPRRLPHQDGLSQEENEAFAQFESFLVRNASAEGAEVEQDIPIPEGTDIIVEAVKRPCGREAFVRMLRRLVLIVNYGELIKEKRKEIREKKRAETASGEPRQDDQNSASDSSDDDTEIMEEINLPSLSLYEGLKECRMVYVAQNVALLLGDLANLALSSSHPAARSFIVLQRISGERVLIDAVVGSAIWSSREVWYKIYFDAVGDRVQVPTSLIKSQEEQREIAEKLQRQSERDFEILAWVLAQMINMRVGAGMAKSFGKQMCDFMKFSAQSISEIDQFIANLSKLERDAELERRGGDAFLSEYCSIFCPRSGETGSFDSWYLGYNDDGDTELQTVVIPQSNTATLTHIARLKQIYSSSTSAKDARCRRGNHTELPVERDQNHKIRPISYTTKSVSCFGQELYLSVAIAQGALLAGGNSVIPLWDLHSGLLRATLSGHNGWVTKIIAARDGAISGCQDGEAKLWNVSQAKKVRSFRSHTDAITSICCANNFICTSSFDRSVCVWDERCLRPVQRYVHQAIITGLAVSGDLIFSYGRDNTIIVHDVLSGRQKALVGHRDWVTCAVPVRMDGALYLFSGSADGTVIVCFWII